MKHGGLLNTDISTLKKPQKESSSKLTSHERLGPEAHSHQTSMQEQSTLNPAERVVNYPIEQGHATKVSRDKLKIDMLLAGNKDDTADTHHMMITENERYQE